MKAAVRGAGVDSRSACPECLRKNWLIGKLGGWIQNVNDDRPGKRTPELLRLGCEDLVEAVAAKCADEILTWSDGLEEGQMIASLERAGCWACCRHHPSFPEGFGDGADAPVAIIGRGDGVELSGLTLGGSVTVVGARRATGYGLEVAASIGRDLAAAGLNVISGLALGIDGAVHRGALERGPTVAVLGSGPDVPYPPSHTRLYRQIVERGVVISEMPPGTTPWKWSFPARNRIMAALSGMTVVVEAAWRSGSLITAEMAADAGRDVGAVPGPVTAGAAAGTNELINSGAAVVRGAQDVLDRLLGAGAGRPLFGPELAAGEGDFLDAVEAGCVTVDQIAAKTGAGNAATARALARLEVRGYLRGSTTGTWARTSLAAYPSAGET